MAHLVTSVEKLLGSKGIEYYFKINRTEALHQKKIKSWRDGYVRDVLSFVRTGRVRRHSEWSVKQGACMHP